MVFPMGFSLRLFVVYALALPSLQFSSSLASPPVCAHDSEVFRCGVESKCSRWMSPKPALEVDGYFLDSVMYSKQRSGYTSVLFYASWCPFSRAARPLFDTLSLLFPQIQHMAVEQSHGSPSVFSMYGIHSFPSVLIANQTSRVRYRGPKDLSSLIAFYEKTTGYKPVQYLHEEHSIGHGNIGNTYMRFCCGSSIKETIKAEPFLVFAVLFLSVRLIIPMVPQMLSHLKAFWALYMPHLNLGMFGETSQLFGRALNMMNVRTMWTKFTVCKKRSLQERAKNARVWASSLASVSLGESSSARSS